MIVDISRYMTDLLGYFNGTVTFFKWRKGEVGEVAPQFGVAGRLL